MFSCRRCNGWYKKDSWPAVGYVDPSASGKQERPDQHLDYDPKTGEIIPKPGLPTEAHDRARRTIDDLGLNRVDVLFYRFHWVRRFIVDWQVFPIGDREDLLEHFASRDVEFVGSMVMVAMQSQEPN